MNIKQFIAPIGAFLSLICLILPWFRVSVLFLEQSFLGIQSGLLAWLVGLIAFSIIAVFFLFKAINLQQFTKFFIIGLSLLAIMIMLLLAFVNVGGNQLAQASLGFGWYGSFLGFIISGAGALFLKGNLDSVVETVNKINQNISNQPIQHTPSVQMPPQVVIINPPNSEVTEQNPISSSLNTQTTIPFPPKVSVPIEKTEKESPINWSKSSPAKSDKPSFVTWSNDDVEDT